MEFFIVAPLFPQIPNPALDANAILLQNPPRVDMLPLHGKPKVSFRR
jgi:hypothetical protein